MNISGIRPKPGFYESWQLGAAYFYWKDKEFRSGNLREVELCQMLKSGMM